MDVMPPPTSSTASLATGIRARNRAELTSAIVATARQHLAVEGAAGLSLRAVARELGMVSSALYRYFPSRDDLLTRLIIEAYDALGAAAEDAEARVARADLEGRFRAIGRAVRGWALEHEHEYALIYGSPVPGYAAPSDTIAPASRIPNLLLAILAEAAEAGRVGQPVHIDEAVRRSIAPVRGQTPASVPDGLLVRGLMAWTYLFGAVSFDLFGHRHNVIADERADPHPFFEFELDRLVELVGLGVDVGVGRSR
jgi:AcrR family transcriptional regulator